METFSGRCGRESVTKDDKTCGLTTYNNTESHSTAEANNALTPLYLISPRSRSVSLSQSRSAVSFPRLCAAVCQPACLCIGLTDPMWQRHRTRGSCASPHSSQCSASLLAVKHTYIIQYIKHARKKEGEYNTHVCSQLSSLDEVVCVCVCE